MAAHRSEGPGMKKKGADGTRGPRPCPRRSVNIWPFLHFGGPISQPLQTISDKPLQVTIDGNADRLDTRCLATSAQLPFATRQ